MLTALNLSAIAMIVTLGAVIIVFATLLAQRHGDARQPVWRATGMAAWLTMAAFVVAAGLGVIVDLSAPIITMTVPLANVWPLPLPDVVMHTGPASVQSAGTTLAEMSLEGVSLPARMLWAAGQALSLLLPAALALLIALAMRALQRGAPFSPVLSRVTLISAVTTLVAGLSAPVLRGIGGSMASHEALMVHGGEWTGYPDEWSPMDHLPQPTVFVPFELWPIGVAVGLFIVAAILRHGQRIQKDTEGLI